MIRVPASSQEEGGGEDENDLAEGPGFSSSKTRRKAANPFAMVRIINVEITRILPIVLCLEWCYTDHCFFMLLKCYISIFVQLVDDGEGEGGHSDEEQGENASPMSRQVHTHTHTHHSYSPLTHMQRLKMHVTMQSSDGSSNKKKKKRKKKSKQANRDQTEKLLVCTSVVICGHVIVI